MKKRTRVLGILCLGVSLFGFSQEKSEVKLEELDEVVITDSRFELKRENSGKTVINISREEIEKNQGRTVADLINTKSGIEINGSRSNAGQNLGTYVRGGNNRQVLVIIDGVQMADPSFISGDYDLRLLNLSQIESIEIIKGASSTLYGSGAATAVISIRTKKASSEKISGTFASSLGTNQTQDDQKYNISDFHNNVAFGGTLEKFTYRAGFSQQFTNGMSALVGTDEKDPFSKYGLDVNLGYAFSKTFTLNVFANSINIESGYDDSFGMIDTDDEFISKQDRIGLSSKFNYNQGSINLNAAYTEFDREYISSFPSESKSKSLVFDIYNKYVFNETFYTIIGVNAIENRVDFDEVESYTNIDPYINAVYVSDFGLNINAGARLNNHSEYGNHVIYNVNPSYVMKYDNGSYSKIFGSYATSFITPSLTQLFGRWGPNPDLKPEDDRTIEGGIEFKASKQLRVSGLYFNREEENYIAYSWQSGYYNAEDVVKTHGVEVELTSRPIEALSLTANYTFTENKNAPALRIPKHKANAVIGYDFSDKMYASIAYQYTDKRLDTGEVTLDAFNVFNFYWSHTAIKNKMKFFVGLDNILNEDYLELNGFNTRGRNAKLGFQLTL
ncbi:TonB-dependent receptor plug domain-containing protein [Gaetbulibacter saemankumensis]|uniref:TonB-dependent receptor plug domain-containing protein n=1 Tax=Gaetbulibacter saemankumensis TaxID=311208 RepID=UPI00047F8260|nr:TonB-dependent receptor plug domain-containing protein [Gaetbulibacter saemankumensis]